MTQLTRADYDQLMIRCYSPAEPVMTHGKKCRLWDSEGNCYLDFGAGIAVNSLGNAPKVVRKALKAQSARIDHISNIFTNDATLALAHRITTLTGFDRVFFTNSGAESNEAALKLARRAAFEAYGEKKDEIISFTHSFHGRTFFTVSVGGQDKYSLGFGPRPGAITHLPFNDIAAFEKQISDRTCAVIFEPVQGEGGVLPVDKAFAKRVRELCDKYHAALILDEVQSGCARSGTFFAFEQIGIRPDIVTTAKGLAGGVPIGCVLATNAFADHFKPGVHGSTFGGNALACAVGNEVLKRISKPKFLDKVKERGAFMMQSLNELNEKLKVFSEVRGMGLLIGCELVAPLREKLGEIQKAALKAGLIILTAGGTTIRLCPPLIIRKKEIKEGVEILAKVLEPYAEIARKAEEAQAQKPRTARRRPAAKKVTAAQKAAVAPAAKPAAAPKAAAESSVPAKTAAKPAAAPAAAKVNELQEKPLAVKSAAPAPKKPAAPAAKSAEVKPAAAVKANAPAPKTAAPAPKAEAVAAVKPAEKSAPAETQKPAETAPTTAAPKAQPAAAVESKN